MGRGGASGSPGTADAAAQRELGAACGAGLWTDKVAGRGAGREDAEAPYSSALLSQGHLSGTVRSLPQRGLYR